MKFSMAWLKEWVPLDLDAGALAARLTGAGLEVDNVTPVAGPFSGVVVGEILSCATHPDADKLSVCLVSDGGAEPVQVVCGAPNARAGLKIPFARIGAELGSLKIRRAKLRGVDSQGMACSARELGLSEDHSGLLELPATAPVGADLRDYLDLDDASIEVELTPNRADCLSIKGLARDASAILGLPCTPLVIEAVPPGSAEAIDVVLADAQDCPRFGARIIRGIDPSATSPLWLKEKLRRCGIRSISLVVDLTNYVMLELGQPMHAYDLDTLEGGITVRRGQAGERLVLLDGTAIDLDVDMLAICDASGPVGLGGIMGGLATGVSAATTNVLLEAAWFRPATIAGRARALGLHSDASHRFERGVDPTGQEAALERLTGLLLAIAGGKPGPVVLAQAPAFLSPPAAVPLRLARLNRVLGSALAAPQVQAILEALGMQLEITTEGWTATAPSSRFDIAIEEDLIEEVARIHGYDRLPATLPSGSLRLPTISERQVPLTRLRECLCAAGYFEAVNYSFVDHGLLASLGMGQGALPLANPISVDMGVMRTSLLGGLMMALGRNLRRQADRVRLFETGVVFHQGDEVLTETSRVAGVACGLAWPEQWAAKNRPLDFYDLKRDVEALLDLRGETGEVQFVNMLRPWLHPGQAAALYLDGREVGWLGAVHPQALARLDIRPQVYAFELDLPLLTKREIPCTKSISSYPSVRRDLAFLVPEGVNYNEIKILVDEIAGDLLTNLVVFDQFSGKNVEKGYKSLAIGLILQDVSCTLTDEVVDALVARLVAQMGSRLEAQLRG